MRIQADFLHTLSNMAHSFLKFGFILLVFSGCSTAQYKYVPSEHQAAQHGAQSTEAVYSVPANLPDGQVKITSLGLMNLKSKVDSKEFPVIHLRMSITNNCDSGEWTLNTQDQFVAFPNDGQGKALVMDPSASSIVQVGPGQLRTVDYFFPLPDKESSPKNLPEFDFHWKIQAGEQLVQQSTSFDRIQIQQPVAMMDPYGPWPYYTYYPYYPYWGGGPRFGGSVVIRR
jgi:hypothetical protein